MLFLDRSIPELTANLQSGSLSFKDLVNETVGVVEDVEDQIHAWVDFDAAPLFKGLSALEIQLEDSEFWPLLAGIPFGAKDIFNTKAYATQMGSPIWEGFTPGNDARVVSSLLNAGALIAGKTVTAEFAVHALNETLNPHDISRTPGTSSSGSAAAVASGMVPFALASQTAGSIIRPASFCGIWGMKPSFGLIPRTGVLKTTDSLDTIGFVAAHGSSLRSILNYVRVRGPNYPFVFEHLDARGDRPKPEDEIWKVGFVKTHVCSRAQPYVHSAVEDLANRIGSEPGFEVEEISWPSKLADTHRVHESIYNKSLSYYFKRQRGRL